MKHVYLFGAGASFASADKPLGQDLVWDYYTQCSGLYRTEGNSPVAQDVKEKKEEFVNYSQFLQIADRMYPELNEFKKWQECIYRAEMYLPPEGKRFYVDEMLSKLIEQNDTDSIHLIRQLILEHITEAAKGSRNKLYKQFLSYLFKQKQAKVSIITLNFDTLLLDYDYEQPVRFNYTIDFDYKDPNCDKWYHHPEGIPLIKLHGSLDWGTCETCKKIMCFDPYVTKQSYPTAHCQITQKCTGPVSPLIILPHQTPHSVTEILWERAKRELSTADTITVIGYSFPVYDIAIRTLFREHANQAAKIEVIDVANPDEQGALQRHFADIFAPRKILVQYDGFEGYVKRYCK